jgi:hypothetical protein
MKNIHILPTNQKSKIFFNHNKGFEKYQFSKEPFVNGLTNTSNQNIYITNDEEIKEGIAEWGFDLYENKIFFPVNNWKGLTKGRYKKIILTTDQDLDGVQAIDDEFLKWFVNNPSCEEVRTYLTKVLQSGNPTFYKDVYKIIIPKEESKQETLEEAAERFANECNSYDAKLIADGVEFGAKWQQENSCEHNYILTAEQGHRIIKCINCNNIQPI